MAKDTVPNKLSWADQMEDEESVDGFALLFPLPPRQVIGPDENGIKKVIEYKFDEDCNKVIKVTTTIRVRKICTKMSKRAIERKSWAQFGDAVDDGEVRSRLTSVSNDDVFLEIKGKEVDETKDMGDDLGKLGNRGGFLILCRSCGKKGDHFTTKCPYKDLAPQSEPLKNESSSSAGAKSNTYFPPRRRNEEHSTRVTNLSQYARESDLRDLFDPFGPITRIWLPPEGRTGLNRGFGYGYANLFAKLEWSVQRSKIECVRFIVSIGL